MLKSRFLQFGCIFRVFSTTCAPDAMECGAKPGKTGEPAESAGNDACETPEERAAAIKTPARRTGGARADRRSGSDFMSERHERPAESRQPFRRAGASATDPAEEACGGTALKTPEEQAAARATARSIREERRRRKALSPQEAMFVAEGLFHHRGLRCRNLPSPPSGYERVLSQADHRHAAGQRHAAAIDAPQREDYRHATSRKQENPSACNRQAASPDGRLHNVRKPRSSSPMQAAANVRRQRSAPSTIRMSSCCVWTSSLR